MTHRERFRAWMRGEDVDRVPVRYGGPRPSTFDAWRKQGLKEEQIADWQGFVGEDGWAGVGKVDSYPLPRFEPVTLHEDGNKKIWIDDMGAKRVDHKNPATPGFVTRSYLEFPVKNREDWEAMKPRYDAADPMRYLPEGAKTPSTDPATWKYDAKDKSIFLNRADMLNNGGDTVGFVCFGPYWRVRDWCGFEGLSVMFYDQPDLVHEMMDFWIDFNITLLEPVLQRIKADFVIISEDMAFKTQSMISQPMMREFMIPGYRKFIPFFKDHGVEFVVMDSDGHNSQILAEFVPAGLEGIQPIEIAAGNDPAVYLEQYPDLIMWGGIDKRELRLDKARTRAEVVKRYAAARKYRRYIPQVDHGVPPDIPVRNFLHMVELLQGFARGEDLDTYEPPCDLEEQLGPIEHMFDPLTAVPDEGEDDAH